MAKPTVSCAETTMFDLAGDLLSVALSAMRVTATLLLNETYRSPWGIAIPNKSTLAQLLGTGPDKQIAAFHYVQQGKLTVIDTNNNVLSLQTGEFVVGFGGEPHCISQGDPTSTTPLEAHLMQVRRALAVSSYEQDTSLICGVFVLSDTQLNPLFASLPAFMRIHASDEPSHNSVATYADMLIDEINRRSHGANYAVHRLLELICASAIRQFASSRDDVKPNWLNGIQDSLLNQALVQFHRNPDEAWSISKLAAVANLSPSRFAARFTSAFGETGMAYVTKWRINMACQMLRTTDQSVEQIAQATGYKNLPAFARAFKRYMGVAPATWRAHYTNGFFRDPPTSDIQTAD